eukprot:514652-Prymnesium_polylepis.1
MALRDTRVLLQRIFEILCGNCERMLRQKSFLRRSNSASAPLECRNETLDATFSAEMSVP